MIKQLDDFSYDQVAALLERYWEGETTLEEEAGLRTYFASAHVDERLLYAAPYFAALHAERAIGLPQPALSTLTQQRGLYHVGIAAAVALLLAMVGWGMFQQARPVGQSVLMAKAANEVEIEDPEQAMAEIKAALALVSSKLNKGKRTATKGLRKVDNLNRVFKMDM